MKKAQRKALVIGISDYTNLQKLDFCKNDEKEIYEILGSLGYIRIRSQLSGRGQR